MVQHTTADEARRAFTAALETAQESGHWMAVAFHVDDNGRVVMQKTSHEFPVADFAVCVRLMRDILGVHEGPARLPVRPNAITGDDPLQTDRILI